MTNGNGQVARLTPRDESDLHDLLAQLLAGQDEPRLRKLRILLMTQDALGTPVALLQGYLSMLRDGDIDNPEQLLPLLLGNAMRLVERIQQLIREAHKEVY
jgi:hypothetical protein